MKDKAYFDGPKDKVEWIPRVPLQSHVDQIIGAQEIEVAEDVIPDESVTHEVKRMDEHDHLKHPTRRK